MTVETAGTLAERARAILNRALQQNQHQNCYYATSAQYFPAEGEHAAAVTCGCGATWPVEPLDRASQPQRGEPSGALVARDPVQSTLDLIDPSRIYTPADIERHILDCVARLETGALFERECVIAAYETKQAFTMAEARALLAAEGRSESQRKAEALVACEEEFNAMNAAAMLATAAKATMHNLRSILSGYQSVRRSVTSAYQGTPS